MSLCLFTIFLPQELVNRQKNAMPPAGVDRALGANIVAERHTVASHRHDNPDIKGDFDLAQSAKACQHLISRSSWCWHLHGSLCFPVFNKN